MCGDKVAVLSKFGGTVSKLPSYLQEFPMFPGHSDQSSSVTLQKLKNCLKWSLVDFYEFFGQKGEEKKKKYKEKLKKKNLWVCRGSNPRRFILKSTTLPTELLGTSL